MLLVVLALLYVMSSILGLLGYWTGWLSPQQAAIGLNAIWIATWILSFVESRARMR